MTTSRSQTSLLSLPEEVLTTIVSRVTDSCIISLVQVCKKLNRVCSSPLEMRQRCIRYRWWEERHEIQKKKLHPRPTDVDWKELFFYRYRVQVSISSLLDLIITNPTNHINNFNRIVDFGYDAKDCLKIHAEVPDNAVDDPLARRYHAAAAIRYIHRRRALSIWNRVREYNDVPLEVALLALELFVVTTPSPDVEDVVKNLDEIAASFLACTPEFRTFDTEEKSMKLIAWMWEQGFKDTPNAHYRALKNVFVGMTIRTVRTANPRTLVAIFCALARRIGLAAHPCEYLGRNLAIIEDPEAGEYQYYTVFLGPGRNPRIDRTVLTGGPLAEQSIPSYSLEPAPVLSVVYHAAQDIIEALQLPPLVRAQQNVGYPDICEHSALYAALTAMVIVRPSHISPMVVQHMTRQIPSDFPMDVRFLEEELLPRIHGPPGKKLLENVCGALRAEDTTPRTVSRRNNPENRSVLHRVGTVFKHRRYDFSGAIFGWTNECRPLEGEEWMARMDVETLPRGRNQPFYHVLVDDGTVRYVAEENIKPIKPKNVTALILLAGKYFKRFDPDEGKFVSNVKTEFPDD